MLEGDFNIKYVIWGDLSLYTKLKAAKLRRDFHIKAMVSSTSGKSVPVGGPDHTHSSVSLALPAFLVISDASQDFGL